MKLRYLIPFMGYRVINLADTKAMNLDPEWVWQSFEVEWLGRGIVIWVRCKHLRMGFDA
jgi:hypothetical protein